MPSKLDNIELDIELTGHYCNQWPNIKILHNDKILFDDKIQNKVILKFNIDCKENNTIRFVHYGKNFGNNNVWDTSDIADRYITIDNIFFNQVSIGKENIDKFKFSTSWDEYQLAVSSPEFLEEFTHISLCGGRMSFNGEIKFDFSTPVYNWIIDQRFKSSKYKDSSYFSDHQSKWWYDRDLKILEEIKHLMKIN